MEIGKSYNLSDQGLNMLALLGHNLSAATIIVVVGEKQPCDCGSKIDRHTDNCMSHYQGVKLPSGNHVFLSDSDVVGA